MNDRCSHSVLCSVDKERTEELLRAIQRKTVTLDTLRYNPLPPCSSPPAPSTGETHTDRANTHTNTHTRIGMFKVARIHPKQLYKCIFR